MSAASHIHNVESLSANYSEHPVSLQLEIKHLVRGYDSDDEYSAVIGETRITLFFEDAATAQALEDAINSTTAKKLKAVQK